MADLFDIVVARKLSGSGGGSSDFSTASVTVNLRGLAYFVLPKIVDEGGQGALMITGVSSGVYEIALYKGYAVCDAPPDVDVSVSGNASLDEDLIYITGDCTITIS